MARLRQVLCNVIQRMRHRLLAITFAGWGFNVSEAVRRRKLLYNVVQRFKNRPLAVAFEGWASNTLELARQRQVDEIVQM